MKQHRRIQCISPKSQVPSLRTQGIRALIMCSILVLGSWNLALGSSKVDSLQNLLQTNIHDTTRINTLNALGWALRYQNPDTAIVLGKQALALAKKTDNERGQANSNSNLGVYHDLKGDYPVSLSFHFKALEIREIQKDQKGISVSLGNIGIVYRNQGDYPKALEYYFKALKMRKELGAKNLIASALGNIGSLYTKTGRFAEAENYLLRSLAIADTIGSLDDIRVGHQNLSHLYDTTACYQLAYEHYKAYSAAKDTLFNEEKSKDLGKLEAKHEMEMAESKRKQLEKEELKLEDERVNRRNLLQYSGALIFIVALFITILFSGRLNIPVRLAEGGVFFTFLLFFEFTLVLLDPYIEEYSSGAPAIKLGFNALLAGLIFPLHSFAETKLKKRMFNM